MDLDRGLTAAVSVAAAVAFCLALPASADPAAPFPFFDESQKDGGTLNDYKDPEDWLITATADWMARLPDSTLLRDISIPGTHDSGARFGGAACQTQYWTFSQQLDAGIRYFDVRNRRTQNSFAIHHGVCFQQMMFGDVLNQMVAFLTAHPRETILMRIKEEHTPESGSEEFQTIWDGYMTRYPGLFLADSNSGLPTLGDARGKIVALRNAGFTGYGVEMYGNSDIEIQDAYQVYWLANDNPFGADTVSLPQKTSLVESYIQKVPSAGKLIINHLSGAVGMIPRDIARATNATAYDEIGLYIAAKKVGTLVMDFPGDRLIYRIIESNFASNAVCAAKTFQTLSDHSYAQFKLPSSSSGTSITFRGGNYYHYAAAKCNRVTWTDLDFTCGPDGQWRNTGSWDADGWCTADSNTEQTYLEVGNR